MFEYDKLPNGMIVLKPLQVKPTDVIKMRSTIKSFLRDWSSDVSKKRKYVEKYLFKYRIFREIYSYILYRGKKREICVTSL